MKDEMIECFACRGCKKKEYFMKGVKDIGIRDDIMYVVRNCQERYILESIDTNFSKRFVDFVNSDKFLLEFVPKFGKYEIEKFIADEFRKSIFISHDLTDLFNTTIICKHNNQMLESSEIAAQIQTRLIQERTDLKTYVYSLDYAMLKKLIWYI